MLKLVFEFNFVTVSNVFKQLTEDHPMNKKYINLNWRKNNI